MALDCHHYERVEPAPFQPLEDVTDTIEHLFGIVRTARNTCGHWSPRMVPKTILESPEQIGHFPNQNMLMVPGASLRDLREGPADHAFGLLDALRLGIASLQNALRLICVSNSRHVESISNRSHGCDGFFVRRNLFSRTTDVHINNIGEWIFTNTPYSI